MIPGWFKKLCKAVAKRSGLVAGALATCAVAAGSTIITAGTALPAWLLVLLQLITVGSTAGSAAFTIQYFASTSEQDTSSLVTDEHIVEFLNAKIGQMLDADGGNALSDFSKNVLNKTSELEQKNSKNKQDHEKLVSITELLTKEQTKIIQTLSETSISFSKLEIETKTKFKAQEKVNTDLEDRLTDCEDEIETLSANNDSVDGLEDNGFFAQPRRRNVASANEVNFFQAATHRINN